MDQTLIAPLNQLETSLNALLTSLTTTNTYAAAPAAAQSLVEADDKLSSALLQLKQHQDNYSRILSLRAEADKLQTQLRDIVRTCVELRSEIGEIHSSILEDTESEDESEAEEQNARSTTLATSAKRPTHIKSGNKRQNNPVDYETLLGFAARIGKHNAAAAIEAERQSNRRHRQQTQGDDLGSGNSRSSSHKHGQDTTTNGSNSQQQQRSQHQDVSESAIIDADPAPHTTTSTTGAGNRKPGGDDDDDEVEVASVKNATDESLAELAAINDTLAQQRAYRGMAFPAAEALRMGALGKLQYLREQEGEDAVDQEVERLVRESEGHMIIAPEAGTAAATKPDLEVKAGATTATTATSTSASATAAVSRPDPQLPPPRSESQSQSQAQPQPQSQTRPPPPSANLPPKPKMTLDLDFPDSDEDEDD